MDTSAAPWMMSQKMQWPTGSGIAVRPDEGRLPIHAHPVPPAWAADDRGSTQDGPRIAADELQGEPRIGADERGYCNCNHNDNCSRGSRGSNRTGRKCRCARANDF